MAPSFAKTFGLLFMHALVFRKTPANESTTLVKIWNLLYWKVTIYTCLLKKTTKELQKIKLKNVTLLVLVHNFKTSNLWRKPTTNRGTRPTAPTNSHLALERITSTCPPTSSIFCWQSETYLSGLRDILLNCFTDHDKTENSEIPPAFTPPSLHLRNPSRYLVYRHLQFPHYQPHRHQRLPVCLTSFVDFSLLLLISSDHAFFGPICLLVASD